MSRVRRGRVLLVAGVGALLVSIQAPPVHPASAIIGTPATGVSATEVFAEPPVLPIPTEISCGSTTFCIGSGNPAMRSIDGGVTWSAIRLDAQDIGGLFSIDCLTGSMCFALENGGQVRKTVDGGTTWATLSTPVSPTAQTMGCASVVDCVAVGRSSSTSDLIVGVTHDGGATWSTSHAGGTYTRAADCASASFCVAVGDDFAIFTNDGGTSWNSSLSLNGGYSGVTCVAPATCLAFSSSKSIVSTNGGATWSPLGGITAASCTSAHACVTFNFSTTAAASVLDPSTLVSSPASLPAGLGSISVAGCSGAVCVGAGSPSPAYPALSFSQAIVLRSTNGGSSWSATAPPPPAETISDLACMSATTCLAVGDDGTLAPNHVLHAFIRRSTDSGASWPSVGVPAAFGSPTSVDCDGIGHCVMAGASTVGSESVVIFSGDAGATWSSASVPSGAGVVEKVTCPAASTCVALASRYDGSTPPYYFTSLLTSTDGGQTWASSGFVTPESPAEDLMCASMSECVVSTRRPNTLLDHDVWYTIDAGSTWHQELLPSVLIVADFRLLGCFEGRCFLESGAYDYSATVISGLSEWQQRMRPAGDSGPMGCAGQVCIRPQGVYGATVVATDDWGVTWWTSRGTLATHRFVRMDCASSDSCYGVAYGGSQLGMAIFRLDVRPRPIVPLVPARLLETRSGPGLITTDHQYEGIGALTADTTLALPVTGRGGVAADATSVLLNVTVTNPVAAGFITVYPCGEARPLASSVNFVAGATVPNLVIAKVGAGGQVCFYTMTTTDLIVDVGGATPAAATSLQPLTPARLLETRSGPGLVTVDHVAEGGGPTPANGDLVLPVIGRGGVSSQAGTVALNVTVTGAVAPGFVTVYPCGTARPNASSVNYVPGQTVANLVVSKIGQNGTVCLYTMSSTHLVVDVTAHVADGDVGFASIVPVRVMETRVGPGYTTADHLYEGTSAVVGNTSYDLPIAGRAGIPTDAAALVLNVTVTEPQGPGFVTVYPCDQPRPTASNLNFQAGQTVANSVISRVGPVFGDICIYSMATTHMVVDVTGYVG